MAERGHKVPNLDLDGVRRIGKPKGKSLPVGQLAIGQEVPGTVIEPTVQLPTAPVRKTPEQLLPTATESDEILAATDRLSTPEATDEVLGSDRARYVGVTKASAQIDKNQTERLEREQDEAEANAGRTAELLRSTFLPKEEPQPPTTTDQAS